MDDHRGHWLCRFPDSCTSLVSLNFACLKGEVNLGALERLVARCPNLRSLRLNRSVPAEILCKILVKAPQLMDLGAGSCILVPRSDSFTKLTSAFLNCASVKSLSGFWEVTPRCLPAVYPICSKLTSLNLSYAPAIQGNDLIKLIRHCQKLQRLWVRSLYFFPFVLDYRN